MLGAVEAVEDARNGRRYARQTIVAHESPLNQLVRELAFLSSLRYAHIVRFHGAYMSPSNSGVKLVMELCEGRSLAAVGEQIAGSCVGEKVPRSATTRPRECVPCSFFPLFSPLLPFFSPRRDPFQLLTSFMVLSIYGT